MWGNAALTVLCKAARAISVSDNSPTPRNACASRIQRQNRSSCIAHGRYAYVCIRTHRACIPAIKLSLAHLCAISSLANLSCVGLGRVRVAPFFSEESQNLHQGRAVDLSRGQVVKKTSPPWSIESNLPHLVQQRVFAIRHCCISEGLEPAESSVRDRYRQGTSQQPSSCLQQQRAFFSGILFAPKECSWSLGNVPQLVIFSRGTELHSFMFARLPRGCLGTWDGRCNSTPSRNASVGHGDERKVFSTRMRASPKAYRLAKMPLF